MSLHRLAAGRTAQCGRVGDHVASPERLGMKSQRLTRRALASQVQPTLGLMCIGCRVDADWVGDPQTNQTMSGGTLRSCGL